MSEVRKFSIGSWTASPALNLLEQGTRSIRIESRAMDVLVFLARQEGAVVSVEELLASVWKGVVVGDSSVYLAIRQLRQALDSSADGTRYIETIPKRGYRLTVPVREAEPEPVAAQTATPASAPGQRRVRWWFGTAVFGAVVLATLVVLTLRNLARPSPETSVAILPFDNLSSDPEQQYFADGITVELLDTLSRIRDLRVTGPTSSFHFKNRNRDLGAIGATLSVKHVLTGNVRRVGDRVRIAVQLNDASTGQQQWSETYERRFDDIFAIQDDIARSVANVLQVELGVGDLGRTPGMTRNVAAYDAYLRAIAIRRAQQMESMPLAIAHLQRAVSLDPSFSVAWTRLYLSYNDVATSVPNSDNEWRQKGEDALDRARALTPDAPDVLLVTGVDETRRGHWREAASVFQRLDASYARHGLGYKAWSPRGIFLMHVGRVREAVPALERGRAEEPLDPEIALYRSLARTVEGNFTAALAEIDRGLALEGWDMSFLAAGLLIALNKQDRVEIDKRLNVLPDGLPFVHLHRGMSRFLNAPDGAAAEIRRMAATANPIEKTLLAFWAAFYQQPELSLELWSEGTRSADALSQPMMRDVRKLPAFKDLVRELGLVEYWRAYGWSDYCRPLAGDDFVCS